jgi:hypothetical protein
MRYLLLVLCACGAPDFSMYPATKCGLHVEGVSLAEAQQVEDATVAAFQSSLDPKLHDVCQALYGWKLTVTSAPIIPGPGTLDDPDPSQPVSGVTLADRWTIKVSSAHFIFPHEAAHVAQGCTHESGLHTGWWNVCSDGLQGCACGGVFEAGKDQLGNPCTLGLVQPELISAHAALDAMLGDTP